MSDEVFASPKPKRKPKKEGVRMKRSRVKSSNPKRRKSEFLRAYGSEERVSFVRGLPCVACGRVGFCDNAHAQTAGMGRKADFHFIVPLCGYLWSIVTNCHGELHRIGIKAFEAKYGINLKQLAAETEELWLAAVTLNDRKSA